MSKNSAIDIILRVRPHKNVYSGFSTLASMQTSTRKTGEQNSIFPRKPKRDISIIRKRNDCSHSTRSLVWRLAKKRSSTR